MDRPVEALAQLLVALTGDVDFCIAVGSLSIQMQNDQP
jgi:hypothetical protein